MHVILSVSILSLIVFCMLPSTTWAQADCAKETAELRRLAAGVSLEISAPNNMKVGDSLALNWQSKTRFPSKLPVYVIFSIPSEIRVQLPDIVQTAVHDDLSLDKPKAPILPGAIVLPSKARAPLGLSFGVEKFARTRTALSAR